MASSGWQGEVTLQSNGFGYDYFKGDLCINSISHSGGTVTVSAKFGVRNASNYNAYYVYPINAKINNITNYVGVTSNNQNIAGGTRAESGSFTFTFDASAGSTSANIEVLWLYNNGTASNSKTYTLYFDASVVAPNQPTVTITERYTNGAKFSVSLSSYGIPSDNPNRYIEAAILGQDSNYGNPYKYATATATNSANITVNNSCNGNLTIQSNARYWYGGYATNNTLNNNIITGSFYTMPTAPVGSNFSQDSDTTASFQLTETSTGQGRTVQLQYRYKKHTAANYGAWTDAGSAGNQQTETVSLTGLSSGDYDVQVRSKTSANDISASNTYENAFSFLEPSITITGVTFEYSSPTTCKANFSYIISSIDSESTHKISAVATASNSQTYSTNWNNKPVTGTYYMMLPVNQTYSMAVNLDNGAATTTYEFETPSTHPSFQLEGVGIGSSGVSRYYGMRCTVNFGYGSKWQYDPQQPSQQPWYNNLQIGVTFYNNDTGAWTGGSTVFNQQTQNDVFGATGQTMMSGYVYPQFTKVRWIVTIYNGKTYEQVTKVVETSTIANTCGKVIEEDGTKLDIIGIGIKDKEGSVITRYAVPMIRIK